MESKVIEQYVQGEALNKFEILPDLNLPHLIKDRYETMRLSYASGLTAGIELMGEFAVWMDEKFYKKSGMFFSMSEDIKMDKNKLPVGYSIPELIELFLKHKQESNDKKD